MSTFPGPLGWIDDEAAAREAKGLSRSLFPHGNVRPGRFSRNGQEFVNFGSNDYLGLAADPRLLEAARSAADRYGWGTGASALVSGWTDEHEALAEDLASFEGAEGVALFPTGFAANLGTIAALVGPGDAVYLDRLNHASLIDGARLSGAGLRVYPHNDADRLASALARDRGSGRYRRVLIATDGVFSMDGDLAPLKEIADISERFDAMLLVDEAHGTGVFGPDGKGACASFGLSERVHAKVGTLSKALGSVGGFVAGPRRLVDHLVNHARSLIYSTAPPASAAAAARAALRASRSEPSRRERAHSLAGRLRSGLADRGLDYGPSVGPIVPVILGEPEAATGASRRLYEAGTFAPAVRPPTVPAGASRLRITVTAAHGDDDVDRLLALF